MSEGLADFGAGGMSGMGTGAAIGTSILPGWGTAIGAGVGFLGGGALSYFGGASNRRLESKANKLSLRGMEQDLELGEFNLSAARRQDKAEREAKKRKEMFGRLMAQYFQRKQGGV